MVCIAHAATVGGVSYPSQPQSRLRRRLRALTVLELVAVLLVTAIVAAITVVAYQNTLADGRKEAVRASAMAFDREYRALLAFEDGPGTYDPEEVYSSTVTDYDDSTIATELIMYDPYTAAFTWGGHLHLPGVGGHPRRTCRQSAH